MTWQWRLVARRMPCTHLCARAKQTKCVACFFLLLLRVLFSYDIYNAETVTTQLVSLLDPGVRHIVQCTKWQMAMVLMIYQNQRQIGARFGNRKPNTCKACTFQTKAKNSRTKNLFTSVCLALFPFPHARLHCFLSRISRTLHSKH